MTLMEEENNMYDYRIRQNAERLTGGLAQAGV